MRKQNGKGAGFSLIEVLITIFILGIVCITLIGVFIYGFNLLAKTKQVGLATSVAQFEVEKYRNMAFASIPLIPLSAPLTTNFSDLSSDDAYKYLFNNDNQPYLRNGRETVIIEDSLAIGIDQTDPDKANIKKMTVTIEWDYRTKTIARGNPMRQDVVTYFAKSGINRR